MANKILSYGPYHGKMNPFVCRHSRGFTLIELSAVLVIIALLIGGIVAGQALTRASQVRAIYSDAQSYINAFKTFQDKYNYLPGDFPTATALWGAESSCPTTSNSRLTCNGDGNGHISDEGTAATYPEQFRAWQQLADADMIPGVYAGIGYTGSANYAMPITVVSGQTGGNIPGGTIEGSGYTMMYMTASSGTAWPYYSDAVYNRHGMFFGLVRSGSPANLPALSAAQGSAIDLKIDDGKPGTGNLQSFYGSDYNNCTTGTSAATAIYNLSSKQQMACGLIFLTSF